ncbi:MAG: UDP-N-acetylmuramate dehydrogenase [Spirochaetales bacterium]|nr:UDP-N-acetylmuramate dehydrogenase [Spirochaetales bacterium]
MNDLIQQNISLKDFTTFKIGGNARYFAEPSNIDEVSAAFQFAKQQHLIVCILGGGANTLVPDEGYNGLVICTRHLNHIWTDGDRIIAECGVSVDEFVDFAAKQGLSGAEFAAGLPGSIGGAIYMNARCYGSEFADIVESVRFIRSGENDITELSHDEIGYAYKHSCFMNMPDVLIVEATFRMKKENQIAILEKNNDNRSDRKKKGQYDFPSAGCIFKNNYEIGIPAGKLIEEAGLKGCSIGGAKVYERHANFIINAHNSTAKDVQQLIHQIQQTLDQKGYHLEPEVRILHNEEKLC